MLPLLYD